MAKPIEALCAIVHDEENVATAARLAVLMHCAASNPALTAMEGDTEPKTEGKQVTLRVNGAVVNQWNDCEVPGGHIGLESEGYLIEFRNILLKRLP